MASGTAHHQQTIATGITTQMPVKKQFPSQLNAFHSHRIVGRNIQLRWKMRRNFQIVRGGLECLLWLSARKQKDKQQTRKNSPPHNYQLSTIKTGSTVPLVHPPCSVPLWVQSLFHLYCYRFLSPLAYRYHYRSPPPHSLPQ